jgi:hypothetical protein
LGPYRDGHSPYWMPCDNKKIGGREMNATWFGALVFVLIVGAAGIYLAYKDKRP